MPKILIVEDEAPNVEILSRLLARKKYDVAVAGNAQDAVAMAEDLRPDLILMDIGIPDVPGGAKNDSGGLEATKQLKTSETTRTIPIVALTAHAMLDDKKRFVEAGCDGVQTKPYVFAELLAEIEQHLNGT
jgi:two-component system cell cycle response regulator DivK